MQSMLQNAKFLQQSQMSSFKIWHVQKNLENFAQGCTSVEPGLTDWDRTQRMIENLFYIQYIYIYIYIYVSFIDPYMYSQAGPLFREPSKQGLGRI